MEPGATIGGMSGYITTPWLYVPEWGWVPITPVTVPRAADMPHPSPPCASTPWRAPAGAWQPLSCSSTALLRADCCETAETCLPVAVDTRAGFGTADRHRLKLRNAKLPKRSKHLRLKIRNAKLPLPVTQVYQLSDLVRATTWDKAPLQGDSSWEQILGSQGIGLWKAKDCESETTARSDIFGSLADDEETYHDHPQPEHVIDAKSQKDVELPPWLVPLARRSMQRKKQSSEDRQKKHQVESSKDVSCFALTSVVRNEVDLPVAHVLDEVEIPVAQVACTDVSAPGKAVQEGPETSAAAARPPWLQGVRCNRRSESQSGPQEGLRKKETGSLCQTFVSKDTSQLECSSSRRECVVGAAKEAAEDKQMRGKCVIVSKPLSSTRYEGHVKWFRGSFGWVECAAVAAMYSGADAYLHINDCAFGPRLGDKVTFLLAESENGHPKALKARESKEPEVIDARDWFAARSKRQGHVTKK
eukprot:TRINITY_DN1002_c0_g1_i4.p1 TRINITY_DN1002_c0_g1~~TRINITY_DN1002_c0_g1_i4.p1  ORF type:complete len:473 (-),score=99.19 TRINITY_DN1002_c0_g1_i4:218-1636(-)